MIESPDLARFIAPLFGAAIAMICARRNSAQSRADFAKDAKSKQRDASLRYTDAVDEQDAANASLPCFAGGSPSVSLLSAPEPSNGVPTISRRYTRSRTGPSPFLPNYWRQEARTDGQAGSSLKTDHSTKMLNEALRGWFAAALNQSRPGWRYQRPNLPNQL